MSLKEKIKEDLKKAMQEKDSQRLSVLRMLNSVILNKEKEKRAKEMKEDPGITEEAAVKASQLTKEEITESILSEIKKRKDSIDQYLKGNRADLADQEKEELAILTPYAPEQMSEAEVKKIIQEAIAKVQATGPQDNGKVMGLVMPQVKGKADGSLVSKIVQEELSKTE